MEKKIKNNYCELIPECLSGNERSWSDLVLLSSKTVYQVIYNTFHTHNYRFQSNDADDVFQNVFLKVLKNIPTLKDHSKFGSWVKSIARNQAIDWMKKRAPATINISDDDIISTPGKMSPSKIAEEENLKEIIEDGMKALSPRERIIIIGFYVENLKYRELAVILKTTVGGIARSKMLAEGKIRLKLGGKVEPFL